MDFKEIGLDGVGWIRLSQDIDPWQNLVYMVMKLLIL